MMPTLKKLQWFGPAAAACFGAASFVAAQTPTLPPQQASPAPSTSKPAGTSTPANSTHPSTSVSPTAADQTPSAPAVLAPAGGSELPNATALPSATGGASIDAGLPSGPGTQPQSSSGGKPVTLPEAIHLAQKSDVGFVTAVTDAKIAEAQRGIALSAILPVAVYHNQYIYTQPLHGPGSVPLGQSPRFIANNSVHEYVSQGLVTETIGAASVADYRKSNYDLAASKARLEVARRGLVNTVISNYYAALAANENLVALQRALEQAKHFEKVSGQLEAGGEVAHADSIKSRLQVQQRERDLADAELAVEQARLNLGVLLFSNPLTGYALAGDLGTLPPLPLPDQIKAAANANNPDLKEAVAAFHAASLELSSSRLDYLPTLSLQYIYGIDATEFAANASDGSRNLGYAAVATLDIPVFDWFATRDRARQSAARKNLAQVALTSTQRKLAASIESLYRAAEVARRQTVSLETSVRDATEALRLTDLRYSAGEAAILEVVDAQNTLITVQNARAASAARYYTALANLQTLTGNLP